MTLPDRLIPRYSPPDAASDPIAEASASVQQACETQVSIARELDAAQTALAEAKAVLDAPDLDLQDNAATLRPLIRREQAQL